MKLSPDIIRDLLALCGVVGVVATVALLDWRYAFGAFGIVVILLAFASHWMEKGKPE